MFKIRATLAVSLLAVASVATAAADTGEIARVVAALNERAAAPAPDGPADDGSPASELGPAAWTAGRPGPHERDCSIDVAVLGASTAAQLQDVVNHVTGDPRIASVTGIAITTATPTLAELQAFDAVLVFTNSTPQNSVLLGDNLADYVDGGGGGVLTMFAIRASLETRTVQGRFMTDNYYCIERSVGTSTTGNATLGTIHAPGHPLVAGVNSFDGGTSSFRSPAPLNANATRIADWSTGQILIAERTDLAGGRVDLGFFAVSQLASAGSWVVATDGAAMLRNAVVVASRCETPAALEGAAPGPMLQARGQNSPNPFNPTTELRYVLAGRGIVHLRVFDVEGRLVRTLAGGLKEAGEHVVRWDGRSEAGGALPSGSYYIELETAGFSASRKALLLK